MTKLATEKNTAEDSKKDLPLHPNIMKAIEEEGKVMVKGRFRNFESPGCTATITVRKYPEKYVPMFMKTMMDNELYEIPLYVARFLNGIDITAKEANCKINTCARLVHGFGTGQSKEVKTAEVDAQGMPVPIFTNKYVKRYGFESLEFDV